ncbi:hypothetical protein JCM8097_002096 [Rhodosporidiobolus ruineniae]
MLRSLVLLTTLAAGLVNAHMELHYPPPINSKYDPQTLESNKDYSMTSPLAADGSNYPCKGYNTASAYSSLSPVATLTAGSNLEIELAGTATHGGGSCQFSVSYDQGKTFAVIHSVIGGCPLSSNYSVPIPSDLPSAKSATFAWTWQNKVGNREEYMNCAIVDIAGSSSSKSYTGPGLFRANTFSDGECTTTEGVDIVYPNPGSSVEYGDGMSSSDAATTLDNCSYDEDTTVTVSPSGSSSSSGSGPASSSAAALKTTTTRAAASTSRLVVQPATTSAAATRTRPSWKDPRTTTVAASSAASMTSPAAASSSKASTTSKINWYIATTTTRQLAKTTTTSAAPAATSSASSSSGSDDGSSNTIRCDTTTTWSLCASGSCTFMGSVAAGTECKNGAIVMASRARMVKVRRGSAHAVHATAAHAKRNESASTTATTVSFSSPDEAEESAAGRRSKRNAAVRHVARQQHAQRTH